MEPFAIALVLLPSPADGRSYRLNEPADVIPSADVYHAATNPDESWIVYVAPDPETKALNAA